MFNDINLGFTHIYMYGVFTGIALIAALVLACVRAPKRKLNGDICYGILFSGVIFGYLCSKLTFVIVEHDFSLFFKESGFVVIGGLIGGVLAAWAYCTIKKVVFIDYFDLCAPSIAIAQGFGRIGCFMAGCCYGRETTAWYGVVFPSGSFAPGGVKLIPTQLISSGLDFLNMVFLLLLAKKAKKKGVVSSAYIIAYSIGRFLLEYLRNDPRGNVGTLSTSQFFSIITFVVGVIYLTLSLKLQKNKPAEAPSKDAETADVKEAPSKDAETAKVKKNSSKTEKTDDTKDSKDESSEDNAVDKEASSGLENYEEPEEPEEE